MRGVRAILVAVMLAVSCTACGPFGSSVGSSLTVSGTGNGDAGGTWTRHFRVTRAPWRFSFRVDCRRAHDWDFDVTLEQMHQDDYFDAVPLDLGWSSGQGPATTVAVRRISAPGEFWFIVRAGKGCSWSVRAPVS
jgi:hypothetical protein